MEKFTGIARTGAWRRKRHGGRRRGRGYRTCETEQDLRMKVKKMIWSIHVATKRECQGVKEGMDGPEAVTEGSSTAESDGEVKNESLAQLSSDGGDGSDGHLRL